MTGIADAPLAPGALDGIRVVEWAQAHLGPAAGMFLADLGADVIHIEEPQNGDIIRHVNNTWGYDFTLPGGRSSKFEDLNRNKRGIAVDLNVAEGREVVYRLVEQADVFITNMRPAAAKKLAMTKAILTARNPDLIYASATSYGELGPEKDSPGLEMMGIARSGMMLMSAPTGGEPIYPGIGTNDRLGGIGLALGILAALVARERQGVVQAVATSQVGWAVNLQAVGVTVAANSGQDPRPPARDDPSDPMYNVYRLGDGSWIALGMIIHHAKYWPLLCDALDLPALADDERFATTAQRKLNRRTLTAIFDQAFARLRLSEWEKRAAAHELIATRVNSVVDLTGDEQILVNRYLELVDHPELGPFWYVTTPLTFEKTPVRIRSGAPALGADTEEVLEHNLGMSQAEIAQLRLSGAIPAGEA